MMERREIVNNNMDCILLDKIDFYLTFVILNVYKVSFIAIIKTFKYS